MEDFIKLFIKESGDTTIKKIYSYELYMTSKDLLKHFINIYKTDNGQLKITMFDQLLMWVYLRPYDFCNKKMISLALSTIDTSIDKNRSNKLKLYLLRQLKISPNICIDKTINIMDGYKNIDIWKQSILSPSFENTLINETSQIYLCVRPKEILFGKWQKNPKSSKHIVILQKRFNCLCFWLVSIILMTESKHEQIMLFKRIFQVGKNLFDKGDYHDASSVIAALNNNDISRLYYLWESLDITEENIWNDMDMFFSALDNYKNYRSGITLDKKIIPFLPVYLRDIITLTTVKKDENSILENVIYDYMKYQPMWWKREIIKEHVELKMEYVSDKDRNLLSDKWKNIDPKLRTNRKSFIMLKRKNKIPTISRKQISVPAIPVFSSNIFDKEKIKPVKFKSISVPNLSPNYKKYNFEIIHDQTENSKKKDFIIVDKIKDFNSVSLVTCIKKDKECNCNFVSKNIVTVISKELENNNPITALKNTFQKLEDHVIQNKMGNSGCIVSTVLFKQEKDNIHIYSANVGDSHIILSQLKHSEILTETHRCSNKNEKIMIEEQGGVIIKNKVNGVMEITRCIGIINGKKYLTAIPFLSERKVPINKNTRIIIGTFPILNFINSRSPNDLNRATTKTLIRDVNKDMSVISVTAT